MVEKKPRAVRPTRVGKESGKALSSYQMGTRRVPTKNLQLERSGVGNRITTSRKSNKPMLRWSAW